jgi:hypothetical protein
MIYSGYQIRGLPTKNGQQYKNVWNLDENLIRGSTVFQNFKS